MNKIQKEQRTCCKVNGKEVIEKFKNEESVMTREENIMDEKLNIPEFLTQECAVKEKKIGNIICRTIGFIVAFGLGVAVAKSMKCK